MSKCRFSRLQLCELTAKTHAAVQDFMTKPKNRAISDESTGSARQGYVEVGRVGHAHGIRGELFVALNVPEAEWLSELESLDLSHKDRTGASTDYCLTIVQVRRHKKGLLFKTKEISDRTQAENLRGARMMIAEGLLVSSPGENIYLAEIKGFMVQLADGDTVGVISGFSSNGLQDLLVVDGSQGEALIPWIEEFIVEIQFDKKVVVMDLPEGLVEVNQ